MITAFDVYLVMQLDSIREFLGLLAALFFFGGSGVAILLINSDVGFSWKELIAPIFAVSLGAISTLLPSSKTAAAMIILPVISSAEFTGAAALEVKEVWELAKEALRGSVQSQQGAMVEKEAVSK